MKQLVGRHGGGIIFNPNVDVGAEEQVQQLLDTPLARDANLRVMPDVHAGAGSVIGTTMRITDKVCPNLVGVDIGCGLMAVPLGSDDIDLVALDRFIRKRIPSGFAKRTHQKVSPLAERVALDALRWDAPRKYRKDDAICSVGTLGGGNHFIEVGKDSAGENWMTIHSGSRNVGLLVATHYQWLAEQTCRAPVPDALKFLTDDLLEDYLHDMRIMQDYAKLNRIAMFVDILDFLGCDLDDSEIARRSVITVHNYIDDERTLRKGAVRAQQDELFLLPLNMADGLLLCRGKGNPDWNESAPHGAGRLYSRTKAFKALDMDEFAKRMEGIYTTSVHDDTLDESPMAYKDGSVIEGLMTPTAETLDRWKPIYSFKARGKSPGRGGGRRRA
ncbi:MAG: RtcB family protein [Coriobacteriia bacterium]|nr:RtcB family protein [Coriobacteriia bacterium]